MFTVKHIHAPIDARTSNAKIENLYIGERVTFCPDYGNVGALEVRTGESLVAALWGGMAYVMNEAGKTVARYDLPAQCAPDGSMDTGGKP